MGTRSTINIKTEDGRYKGIYCHWDGYVSHNGRILVNYYTTTEQVEALIALGNISSLGETIEACKPYGGESEEAKYTAKYPESEEYNYVFDNGAWTVNWRPLSVETAK